MPVGTARRLSCAGLVLVATMGLGVPAAAAAAQTCVAERYDVVIEMQADRSLLVTETMVFRFEGDPFTRVFRGLTTRRSDGISRIEGRLDGELLPRGRRAGSIEVDRENGIQITWRFAPVSGATRTFTLTYHVAGAVTAEDGADELSWTPLPSRHDYRIEQARIRLVTPPGARLAAPASVGPASAAVTSEDGVVVITAGSLGANDTVVARLRFATGTFDATPPRWQTRQRLNARFLPVFLSLAGTLLLGGLLGMVLFRRTHGYEGRTRVEHERSLPPEDLAPGLAGTLLQVSARPSWAQGFGTLLDLARRSIVAIEEEPPGRWRTRQFAVRLKKPGASLDPHEQRIVDIIFRPSDGDWQETVPAKDVLARVTKRWAQIRAAFDQELSSAGLLDPGREGAARGLRNLGILLVIGGGLGFIPAALLIDQYGTTSLFVPGALEVLGLIALILAASFPRLSESGALRAQAWRQFAIYVKHVIKGRHATAAPAPFDRYLPYAAAFGSGAAWVKHFAKEGHRVPPPSWFHPLDASPEAAAVAFAAFIGSAATTTTGTHGAGTSGPGGGGSSGAR